MKWAAIIPLLALYSSSAVAQAVQEWMVTVQRVSGNNQSCAQGLRGKIGIANGAMSFYLEGTSYSRWTVALAADGSADTVVIPSDRPQAHIRLKIPAGAGPREVGQLSERSGCGYRFIPD
jgi:hypothetical protein